MRSKVSLQVRTNLTFFVLLQQLKGVRIWVKGTVPAKASEHSQCGDISPEVNCRWLFFFFKYCLLISILS